ncbi:peptidoglycan editing factor PgeF [Dongia sp.]|uniref:peptidoglycan editing factor PgeF n=1 Tax=Dongia sp. TaxID=1977262 RepID=UPI003752C99A
MIQLDNLKDLRGIRHGFLTRRGGVSDGLYASLNCGLGSKDDQGAVVENRARALRHAGLDPDSLSTAYQVHSAKVAVVDEAWDETQRPQVDGLVTRTAGRSLGILTADCVPVLLADPEAGVIGAAHAGWKGAIGGVLQETVAAMERLGAQRARIQAGIGPAIAQKSYEVGPEFPQPFIDRDRGNARFFSTSQRCRHFMFDLTGFVEQELQALGLDSIARAGHDTCAEAEDFFSYRRTTLAKEPDYGRQISLIGLV